MFKQTLALLVTGVAMSGTCFAEAVQFDFQTILTNSSVTGASVGDTVTWSVYADNGGTDLLSETWRWSDITSGQITAGSYEAYFVAQNLSAVVFMTDAAGALTFSNMVFCCHASYDRTLNSDNVGSSAVLASRNALQADETGFPRTMDMTWDYPTYDTHDPNQWTVTAVGTVITETIVTIDIKPGSETNNINPNSNGLVAVAILTADAFDALQVDPDTAKFGPSGAIAERYSVVDVDRDGDEDLLLHFRTQQTGIGCTDTQATLVAELYDGTDITGTDSIATVGCMPGAVIEAESMALSGGYAVEDNAAASDGQLIRRRDAGGQPATASARFAGSAGVYDIEVGYFDESDGRSSLAFLLNVELLDQWIADEDPACRDCASPNERTLRSRVVARGIRLVPGDELALQGTGEYYEYARFDNIALSQAGFNTLEAEDMTLDDGFVVEANTAASGGLIIRGNGPADATPGQASAAFMGSEGQYNITVTYFDEYDGISSMAMFLNNQLLEQWLAEENPTCRDCASPNERTLRSRVVATGIEISPGDEIRLESTVNHYEYGRFDKIDFTLFLSP